MQAGVAIWGEPGVDGLAGQAVTNWRVERSRVGERFDRWSISTPTTWLDLVVIEDDAGRDLFGFDDGGVVEAEVEGVGFLVNV